MDNWHTCTELCFKPPVSSV